MLRRTVRTDEGKALSWNAVLSTFLPALVLALGVGIALPAIPTLARSFHVSFGLATFVTTSFLIGNVAGTLPSGWLVDRFGRRRVMVCGPLLTAVMAFLVATSQTFPELVAYRFFDGFAAQIWLVGRMAGISHGAAPDQRGKHVSWMFGMNNTGRLAGPIIGGFIATSLGVRAPFYAYAFLALGALVLTYLFTPDTPPRQVGPAAQQQRYLTLRQMVRPRLAFFGVALFSGLARGPVQADLLHLYAAFVYHLSPVDIGYLATAASAVSLPIGFIAGWMMDRFGRKRTMVPGFAGVTISMIGLAISAAVHLPFAGYVTIFLIGIVTQSLTGGSIQTIGADVAPPEARGRFLGVWRFFGQGGGALSPVIFALLASSVGYASSFLFVAASAGVVAGLGILAIPETGRGPVSRQDATPALQEQAAPAEATSLRPAE